MNNHFSELLNARKNAFNFTSESTLLAVAGSCILNDVGGNWISHNLNVTPLQMMAKHQRN